MVSIRLRLEIPAPTAEGMKGLPIHPRELVIDAFREVIARTVKQVEVNGKTYNVEAVKRANSETCVGLRLLGATDDFTDSAAITLLVDMVKQPGEEPSE